jgi:type I restriction enzyme S subunit
MSTSAVEVIPASWKVQHVESCTLVIRSGFASGKHNAEGEGVVHVRPMNISRLGALDFSDTKFVVDSSDRRLIRGDVVFNNTNSPALVGKTAYVDTDLELAFSNHMTCLRADPEVVDGKFLAMQLHALQLNGYFESICANHVNQASVSGKRLATVELLVPPLEEQERIVEVLEEHLSRLDATLANVQAVRTKAAQFRRSLLHAGTTGELFEPGIPVHSLPDGWVEARVGDLLDGIEAGKSFACDGRPAEDGELGVVKVSAMTWGEFDPAENKALSPGTEVDDRWRVGDGDLLLSRANTVDYVGACVLVRGNHPNLVLSDKSLRLLPCDGVDHRWLLYALRAPLMRAQIEEVATGTKESMRNISQAKIRALKVVVPLREQQGRIADHLAMYMSQLDATLAAADRVEAQCAALRRSLLHAAFTGKLTERWRETAGV